MKLHPRAEVAGTRAGNAIRFTCPACNAANSVVYHMLKDFFKETRTSAVPPSGDVGPFSPVTATTAGRGCIRSPFRAGRVEIRYISPEHSRYPARRAEQGRCDPGPVPSIILYAQSAKSIYSLTVLPSWHRFRGNVPSSPLAIDTPARRFDCTPGHLRQGNV